ncbi:RNA polymerase sigma factor [Sphingomonas sp. S2-65]|uniref:RNA polymerase sigma factor n=1 Tax=Sphingomonas sp. S2-65 TaxID=2903960 RepID=UPI001F286D58|nr:sigma-70 family RNA polymerase sigma factor [Sphingomonas sp. S2-65]UYY59502.1 sigma-70 family RNA polymerase sigma factor [Sphingomonas sp. S2-65]
MAREILPHEADVRGWLVRRWGSQLDPDDVIQEAFCRLAALDTIDHIASGRAYFFTTARSIAMDLFRREKVAGQKAVTDFDFCSVEDEYPRADRAVEARQELVRIDKLLSAVSLTCRRVIELRRLQGLSQRETAERLGISEHSVENHVARGIRRVMKMAADQDEGINSQEAASFDGARDTGTH